jgi:hypothetical protein
MEKDEMKICNLCRRKTRESDWDTHWKMCHLYVVENVQSESTQLNDYQLVVRTSKHAQQVYIQKIAGQAHDDLRTTDRIRTRFFRRQAKIKFFFNRRENFYGLP